LLKTNHKAKEFYKSKTKLPSSWQRSAIDSACFNTQGLASFSISYLHFWSGLESGHGLAERKSWRGRDGFPSSTERIARSFTESGTLRWIGCNIRIINRSRVRAVLGSRGIDETSLSKGGKSKRENRHFVN
jgi:hypothetical protein